MSHLLSTTSQVRHLFNLDIQLIEFVNMNLIILSAIGLMTAGISVGIPLPDNEVSEAPVGVLVATSSCKSSTERQTKE